MPAWNERPSSRLSLEPLGEEEILRILLERRGLEGEEGEKFLRPNYDRDLHDPFLFRAMEKVMERFQKAKEANETIGIFGDFDADGVTSSVIMRETLEAIGFSALVYIPHKIDEGHGLHRNALDYFQKNQATLVLTLDCGMMNHAEIEEASRRGMEVVIIDHHHVPEVLPDAFAIINPKLPNETYPFRDLCGAGTSFKVATALYETFLPEEKGELKWLLDVVATGTVADVMPLIGENRVIVKYGLIVLQKTRRPGFQEMFLVGRIPVGENQAPDAHTIGFQIAPRINAASRMAHGMLAHELLMAGDRVKARALALELEAYNIARQKTSQETTARILTLAEEKYREKKFIFAVGEEYPLGIIGLVAGRVAHSLGKPTCILQKGAETSTGSFRSIPGLNIIELIEKCGELLEKFGGHEQAAGMTIRNDRLEAFYERFDALVEEELQGQKVEPVIDIDFFLHPGDVTLSLAEALSILAPFGEGNREPVFALEDMRVVEARTVGKEGKHWKLTLKNGGAPHTFDAVGWSLVENFPDLQSDDHIDIAFQLEKNTWNGRTTVQLKLLDIHKKSGL